MYFIYRHYSKDGTLLYVGLSANVIRRHKLHSYGSKTTSPWFDDVRKVTFEMIEANKAEALDAEREAIAHGKPLFNKVKKHSNRLSEQTLAEQIEHEAIRSEYAKAIEVRRAEVRQMKQSGMTWQTIGNVLGITRQRAQQIGRERK